MVTESCKDCYAHSGIAEAIQNCKQEVKEANNKVEKMQRFLIATLATAVLSLFGIITVLLRT